MIEVGVSGGISLRPITCDACQNNGVAKMIADAHNGENEPPPANTEPMPTRIVAVASIWRADGRSPTKMVERINE